MRARCARDYWERFRALRKFGALQVVVVATPGPRRLRNCSPACLLLGAKLPRLSVTSEAVFDPQRRFTPINCRTAKGLFDHLVSAGEQRGGDCKAERFGSLQIDDKLEPRRLNDR